MYYNLDNQQVISLSGKLDSGIDFSDVCHMILGRWAQVLAVVSSLLTLLGGAIVYWILLSNFFFNVVNFIYRKSIYYPLTRGHSTSDCVYRGVVVCYCTKACQQYYNIKSKHLKFHTLLYKNCNKSNTVIVNQFLRYPILYSKRKNESNLFKYIQKHFLSGCGAPVSGCYRNCF